jgi:hypothetical protein
LLNKILFGAYSGCEVGMGSLPGRGTLFAGHVLRRLQGVGLASYMKATYILRYNANTLFLAAAACLTRDSITFLNDLVMYDLAPLNPYISLWPQPLSDLVDRHLYMGCVPLQHGCDQKTSFPCIQHNPLQTHAGSELCCAF